MAGWFAKAVTPANASSKAKAITCGVTTILVSAATFGAVSYSGPSLLHFVDPNITLTIGAIENSIAAAYTGACTAMSYVLGGGFGGGQTAAPKRPTLNLR